MEGAGGLSLAVWRRGVGDLGQGELLRTCARRRWPCPFRPAAQPCTVRTRHHRRCKSAALAWRAIRRQQETPRQDAPAQALCEHSGDVVRCHAKGQALVQVHGGHAGRHEGHGCKLERGKARQDSVRRNVAENARLRYMVAMPADLSNMAACTTGGAIDRMRRGLGSFRLQEGQSSSRFLWLSETSQAVTASCINQHPTCVVVLCDGPVALPADGHQHVAAKHHACTQECSQVDGWEARGSEAGAQRE